MKSIEIIKKIPKLPVPSVSHGDIQVILRLVTVLAATHLANKVSRLMKEIDQLENPEDFYKYFR